MTDEKSEIEIMDEQSEVELGPWFSTYGLITAERILGTYQIKLSQDKLSEAFKSTFSFYHQVLEVPLKHVLNGIVLEQANDYSIYAQKIFIDYLLSAEHSKADEAHGASSREAIENERQQLVILGEEFHKKEIEHLNLIATSQSKLIKITAEFNLALEQAITSVSVSLKQSGSTETKTKIEESITYALTYCDLIDPQLQSNQFLFLEKMNEILKITLNKDLKEEIMEDLTEVLDVVLHFKANIRTYLEQAKEINVQANLFRTQFYDAILRVTELINLLPDYRIDPVQDAANRETLYFDKSIGSP